jgi:hypothetical protein
MKYIQLLHLQKCSKTLNEKFQFFKITNKGLQIKPPIHKPLPYTLKFKKKHGYLQKEFVENAKV